jgi:hypothetical protein
VSLHRTQPGRWSELHEQRPRERRLDLGLQSVLMNLNMTINWEVQDADAEVESALEEVIAEEARSFTEAIRRRLAAEGITDISMNLTESSG